MGVVTVMGVDAGGLEGQKTTVYIAYLSDLKGTLHGQNYIYRA